MSDRIAIMRAGRIEQLADAETIYSTPASAYVAGFIGQQNFFEGTMEADGSMTAAIPTSGAVHLQSATPTTLASGTAARGAVRPEDVLVSGEAPGASGSGATGSTASGSAASVNAVRGELVSVSHLGETLQYLVDLGGGRSLLARRPRPGAPRLELRSTVWCTWSPDSVLLFPQDADLPAGASETPKE